MTKIGTYSREPCGRSEDNCRARLKEADVAVDPDAATVGLDLPAAIEAVFTPFLTLVSAEDYNSKYYSPYFGGLGADLSRIPEVVHEIECQKADILTLKSGALEDVGPALKERAQNNALKDPAKFC